MFPVTFATMAFAPVLLLLQYHPPFSPSWQRLNEVLLEVKGTETLEPSAS